MSRGRNPDHPSPIYQLGRLAARIETAGKPIPEPIIAELLSTPLRGLPLLVAHGRQSPASFVHSDVAAIVGRLTVDDLPAGPLTAEQQAPFWMGFYQQRAALSEAAEITPDELRRAGEAAFGARWQADLTEALSLTDSARLREWLRGDRKVPRGVVAEVLGLLRYRSAAAKEAADALEAITQGAATPPGAP